VHDPETKDGAARRVVLVDDHGLLSRGLALALEAEGMATQQLTDPDAAARVVADLGGRCLVLLDVQFTGSATTGSDLVGPLVQQGATVVMLTGVDDDALLGDCLARGAAGVIRKSVAFDQLLDGVRRAFDGEPVNPVCEREELLRCARERRAEERRRWEPFERLSAREAEVLSYLTQGFAADAIAEATYVSLATVRTQIQAVLRKLEVRSQLAAVAMARAAGWQGTAAPRRAA
jgi:DNA-binding NarL/FixJ family response regulator